mgnify:CR=1 FL=1
MVYGEFEYRAVPRSHSRRIAFKIEKPYGQMDHMYTFVVTTMKSLLEQVIRSAGYITFKLCSRCPYKKEFFEILTNIRDLEAAPLLE